MAEKNAPTSGPGFSKPVKKIDVHTHLAKEENAMGLFTAEERIEFDKVMGIDKCVILPFAGRMPVSAGTQVPPSTGLLTPEDACEVAARHPDHFAWFCNVFPEGTDATYAQLKKYKEMGACGVGEFGSLQRFDDPMMDHLFSCCEELGLPLLFHMSPNGINYGVIDEAGLPLLEKALLRHPKMAFIGHSQPFWFEISTYPENLTPEERNIYPGGRVTPGRVPYLLDKYPNLYADLSADSGGNALMRDPEYGIEFLNRYQDKLMFGTDICNTEFIYPLGSYLDSLLHQLKISEEVYSKVCRLNAQKLLGL